MTNKDNSPKRIRFYNSLFFWVLVVLGTLGGLLALTVPLWKSWTCVPFLGSLIPADSKDYPEPRIIADLRLHVLYITGGIIAILTLLQTYWKNQVDRRKVEDDIQKNKNDHIRQVHAERRSRYTKAIEQLANEKATVRLGGIYTLVGLVDEWLADDTLNPEERQKEGQVIINNLCSYIRSPFSLAEKRELLESKKRPRRFKGDFIADSLKLREEQNLRVTIFREMSVRVAHNIKEGNSTSEIWRKFVFNFSESQIFYPLPSMSFHNASFFKTDFYGDADFSMSIFYNSVNFSYSHFHGRVIFLESQFLDKSRFIDVTLDKEPVFHIKRANTSPKPKTPNEYIYMSTFFSYNSSHIFSVEKSSRFNFNIGKACMPLNNKDHRAARKELNIPVGSCLIDPESDWDEKTQRYTYTSLPAK
ncbi:pentapeptide repeat-containing protein [Rothia mucilaginosa]|uniref:pentapeptide repeat-containing protein n=1 Tax=Rothia mucilaginosa TaxID=43675 RepID=UPI0028E376F8|nr:pentapeptide repeat-containing protein [Rothia mucilaginosa]